MKKVGVIGFGYWGKILHSKLEKLSDVKFICTSKDTFEDKLDLVCKKLKLNVDEMIKKVVFFSIK